MLIEIIKLFKDYQGIAEYNFRIPEGHKILMDKWHHRHLGNLQ